MIKSILKKCKKDHSEKRVTFATNIENKESEEYQITNLFHVIWNIRGMPKKNEFNNNERKIEKQAILQQITELVKKQDCVAGIKLLETNIKEDQQEFNESRRALHNHSQQQLGDGICTQTDYSNYMKIINKLNSNKIQIMRINIGLEYITLITWHRAHNPTKAKEETTKLSVIIKEIEADQYNLGTLIAGDFNCDLQDKKQWKKLKEKLDLKVKRTINSKTRKNKQLDDILITYKLRKQCESINAFTLDRQNNPSDHANCKPTLIYLSLLLHQLCYYLFLYDLSLLIVYQLRCQYQSITNKFQVILISGNESLLQTIQIPCLSIRITQSYQSKRISRKANDPKHRRNRMVIQATHTKVNEKTYQ